MDGWRLRGTVAHIVLILLIATAAQGARGPCDGVDRSVAIERKAKLERHVARLFKVPKAEVLQSFRLGAWNILYVETYDSDEPFVFFRGDPLKTSYITLWSGAAGYNEEEEIFDWTRENAPGIPRRLARCFAYHVTKARDQ